MAGTTNIGRGPFLVAIGDRHSGALDIDQIESFIAQTLEEYRDRRAEGIKASHSVVAKVLGETYAGLIVSPQTDWYPGERVEVHFAAIEP